MSDEQKQAALDALIALIGWEAVVHMVPEPRVIRYNGNPGIVVCNLRERYFPSVPERLWKPIVFNLVLKEDTQ